MSDADDSLIARLLNADAPAARDPLFRVRVLERREQRRFQRRSMTMLAVVVAIIVVSSLAIRIGGGTLQTTGVVVVGTALAIAYPAFRRALPQMLKRLSI